MKDYIMLYMHNSFFFYLSERRQSLSDVLICRHRALRNDILNLVSKCLSHVNVVLSAFVK